jgi:hypothetical protein
LYKRRPGIGEQEQFKMEPIFISFYTTNGSYPAQARRLEKSLKLFNLKYDIQKFPPFNTWVEALRHKSVIIKEKLIQYRQPVVWIDCDCVIKNLPEIFFQDFDFAIINWFALRDFCPPEYYDPNPSQLLASGGVSMLSPNAMDFLHDWIASCRQQSHLPDDQVVNEVWSRHTNLAHRWLPAAYLAGIFPVPEPEQIIWTEFKPYQSTQHREAAWQQEYRSSSPSGRPKTGNKKIGRNEPCPCLSGKKYKHCCGA